MIFFFCETMTKIQIDSFFKFSIFLGGGPPTPPPPFPSNRRPHPPYLPPFALRVSCEFPMYISLHMYATECMYAKRINRLWYVLHSVICFAFLETFEFCVSDNPYQPMSAATRPLHYWSPTNFLKEFSHLSFMLNREHEQAHVPT